MALGLTASLVLVINMCTDSYRRVLRGVDVCTACIIRDYPASLGVRSRADPLWPSLPRIWPDEEQVKDLLALTSISPSKIRFEALSMLWPTPSEAQQGPALK